MTARALTRRRALAPLAALSLASLPLASAVAQPAQPGPPRGFTAAQLTELRTALRYLIAAKRHVAAAALGRNHAERLNTPIDTAIEYAQSLVSGRVRP